MATRDMKDGSLARVPLFTGLPAATLQQLLRRSEKWELPPGKALFRAGERPSGMYVLISGSVKITTGASGANAVVRQLGDGDILGTAALVLNEPHVLSAYTTTKTRGLHVPRVAAMTLMQDSPALSYRLLKHMSRSVRELLAKATSSSRAETLASKVVRLLVDGVPSRRREGTATVKLVTSKRAMAASFGVTPEALSRTFKQLTATGLIAVGRDEVKIADVRRLRAWVKDDVSRDVLPSQRAAYNGSRSRRLRRGNRAGTR